MREPLKKRPSLRSRCLSLHRRGGMTSTQDSLASPDVDKGWAFAVNFAAMLVQAMTIGLAMSSSIFYTTLLDAFEESPTWTAWSVNLQCFTFFLTGEIANCVAGVFGPRVTIAIGGVVSSLGFFACSFATNLVTVLSMHGIVAGLGFSLCYFSTFPIITVYFRKMRVLAFAIASSGAGLGLFAYTPFLRAVIDVYEWKSAFLLLAGVNLNLLVCAAVMMPPRVPQSILAESKLLLPSARSNLRQKVRTQLRRQARDILLFQRPRWVLFTLAYFSSHVGISGFYTHITKQSLLLGYSPEASAFLVSLCGIGSLTARLGSGVIGRLRRVHMVGLFLFLFSLVGVSSLIVAFTQAYAGLAVCSFICGFGTGGNGIYPESIIHIIGITHLSPGISYSTIAASLGMSVGGPLAASIFEMDPSYRSSFLVVGVSATLGALLNLPSWLTLQDGKVVTRGSAEKREIKLDEELGVEGFGEDLEC